MKLLGKASDNELLWIFRTQLRRMGEGPWGTMPPVLQKYVTAKVRDASQNMQVVGNHVRLCLSYDRTWAAAPLARAFVFRAAFAALWDAGQESVGLEQPL